MDGGCSWARPVPGRRSTGATTPTRNKTAQRFGLLIVCLCGACAALAHAAGPPSDLQPELRLLLARDLKFSAGELAELERGKTAKHVLPATASGEVAVAGAVRVHATKDTFAAAYRDIRRFKQGPDILEVGRFSNPPRFDDLASLTVVHEDVDLRDCKVGDCDIRLPADVIARFQHEVDWKGDDADAQAARLFKHVLFDEVAAYVSGSSGRILQYDDDRRPVRPVDDFAGLLKNSPYLDAVLPGLSAHFDHFPNRRLDGVDDFLYWSKEKFGLTPFISVTHVALGPTGPHQYIAATRDVYSTRYVDASLSLAIASESVSDSGSIYLVYVNRSRANALKGAFSKLRRAIVERRARGSLEDNLKNVKRRLEEN
jgi:hypothetical protein